MAKEFWAGRMYRRLDDGNMIRVGRVCSNGYVIDHLDKNLKYRDTCILMKGCEDQYERFEPVVKIDQDKELFDLAFAIVSSQDINENMSGQDVGAMINVKHLFRDLWHADIGTDGRYKKYSDAYNHIVRGARDITEDQHMELENQCFEWAFGNIINLKEIFAKSKLFNKEPADESSSEF